MPGSLPAAKGVPGAGERRAAATGAALPLCHYLRLHGTGKTALLTALADAGAQVIDLEGWPIIAARCWGRVTRHSHRKSALTRCCGTPCARWTRRDRCSLNRKARRSVWCKCPTRCVSR